MRVHHSEGVAIRADLESCVVIREGGDEAFTEERTGQPSSRERLIPDADTVTYVETMTSEIGYRMDSWAFMQLSGLSAR